MRLNKNLGVTNQLRPLPSQDVLWMMEMGAIQGIRDSSPIQSYLKKVTLTFLVKNRADHRETKITTTTANGGETDYACLTDMRVPRRRSQEENSASLLERELRAKVIGTGDGVV